jgi:hypothetical protein
MFLFLGSAPTTLFGAFLSHKYESLSAALMSKVIYTGYMNAVHRKRVKYTVIQGTFNLKT